MAKERSGSTEVTAGIADGSTMDAAGDATKVTVEPDGAPAPTPQPGGDRYLDLGALGEGGMGEVRRVYDRVLKRDVARKTLRWTLLESSTARRRFEAEANMTAGLAHPSIVPIHDRGRGVDGAPWYTMKLVEGRTLSEALAEGLPLRRAVEALARVCEAMAYAHDRGVIHRDIKPANIMLGAFGEVLLMDWGLARRVDRDETPVMLDAPSEPGLTRMGQAMGTPAYMAPEQLDATRGPLGPPADVYALGGTLYQIVAGVPPWPSRQEALTALVDGRAARLSVGPEPLRAICARALCPDPAGRYADAGAMGDEIHAWLSGEVRRAQALKLVAEAAALAPKAAALRAEADRLVAAADAHLGPLPPHTAVEEKAAGWVLEDAAAERRREARIAEVKYLQTLQTALRTAPDLPEACERLTAYYRRRLLAAEGRGDADSAAEYAELLRSHDPVGSAAWLRGDGAVTLVTDPPGARVELARYVVRGRRLVPEPLGTLPPTPLVAQPLPMGSYALTLSAPGYAPAIYPVHIARGAHWDGLRAGETAPHPIRLLPEGALDADTVYVPAGWCQTGGAEATDGLPRRRVWIDAFAICRHPVTNAEYIEFLHDLLDQGREAEALRYAPVAVGGTAENRRLAYGRGDDGRFHVDEAEGVRWYPDSPVGAISWRQARAYTAWRAARDGRPWRLVHSLEWEKAARGVDGRPFGWGSHFDPTWTVVALSRSGRPAARPLGETEADVSPYGVMGQAGNTRDLCLDRYRRDGPPLEAGRLVVAAEPIGEDAFCVVKGGAFCSVSEQSHAASRFGFPPSHQASSVGFRLAMSL